jgi:Holliday junction resolvasome RuvABC endonuclease subunit
VPLPREGDVQVLRAMREELPMTTLRVMGVDPGFASMGVTVLEAHAGRVQVISAEVLRTKKATKKALRDMRVSADDQRRLRAFWVPLHHTIKAFKPQGLAVETYAPQRGRGGGNAWKVAMAYGLVHGVGLAHGLAIMSFQPADLKRTFPGKLSASKEEVATILFDQVDGLEVYLQQLPSGQHEHVTDAAGHALLGLFEMIELRRSMGMISQET